MAYIVRAFKSSQQSIFDLRTPILHQEGGKSIFTDRDPGINFMQAQGFKLDAPFALGVRFTQEQPYWDYPKVTNEYANEKSLLTGEHSLLHLVTLFQRAELVKSIT